MYLSGSHTPARRCGVCQSEMFIRRNLQVAPLFTVFEFQAGCDSFVVSDIIKHDVDGHLRTWRLVGTIYLGSAHFTCRYIDSHRTVWYHDGMTTRNSCLRENVSVNMNMAMNRSLTHALYVLTA